MIPATTNTTNMRNAREGDSQHFSLSTRYGCVVRQNLDRPKGVVFERSIVIIASEK